ncbi:MAG TPA: DUF6785 family protein [Abditibacteriaceae bacterium]|jgi:hypothetical protein
MKTTAHTSSHEGQQAIDFYPHFTASVLPQRRVSGRAFWLGLLLAAGLAALNCWIEIVATVHFLGGVQMPLGSIFVLLFLIGLNWPMRSLGRRFPVLTRIIPPFSPTELLTVYLMGLFAALISTPGADNFFITVGPSLFYFSKRENGWADLFYSHVPSWFAPGWNGQTYQREVIEPIFTGGLSFSEIPWHAWTLMIVAWSVLLLCVYASLFFGSLLLRRQWIENEALSFPLVHVPLQMVQVDEGDAYPPAAAFWGNRLLWLGIGVAFFLHFVRGMSQYYPDWPKFLGFQNAPVSMFFTERPWNVMGRLGAEFFLGAVGIAFLLTREVSFSFWFFFLAVSYQMVLAEQLGFGAAALPRDNYLGRATFITFQSVGGWLMLAISLLWAARAHLQAMGRAAWQGENTMENEPFSPRFALGGFVLSFLALLGWSWFAGINPLIAALFFTIYLGASIVIARLVIEGGFLFPQLTFAPMEVITSTLTGTGAVGAASLTKLAFVQPSLFSDMRTNVLPGFLHTLKIAHELKLDRSNTRRLMGSVAVAVALALGVTIFVSIWTLYSAGGLTGYPWFTQDGGRQVFNSAASTLSQPSGIQKVNWLWMAVGVSVTLGLIVTRSRFAWFPLHPLGYIVASSYPITRLWFSFFLGWLIKTLLTRFAGHTGVQQVQPLMIGFILGNAAAMMVWMLIGLWQGSQIPYFPA